MKALKRLLDYPAGRAGIIIGLLTGIVAVFMGATSKALLLVAVCRFVAGHLPQKADA